MNRDAFLNELRIALQGQIAQSSVNEHLRYYENYIVEESRKGRTEAEVIASLGSPRLIAKTITDTENNIPHQNTHTTQNEINSQINTENNNLAQLKNIKWKFWIGIVFAVLLFIAILAIAARVVVILIPLIIPIVIIGFIYKVLFSGKKK